MSQPIPLVDLKAQYATIQSEVDRAIRRVVENTNFIMGSEVSNFEKAFANFCGVKHCVGVGSGTAALELVLRALGIGPGDEVITVAHTFIATAEAISAVGALPIFIDIDPQTYNMSSSALVQTINERTQAIIPVHIYGQPADMTTIGAIASQHNIPIIEDAAQAHGAIWAGRKVGGLGRAACFSFYPGKNLGAYGDAGAVTTDDDEVAAQVRLLRNHGRHDKYLHEIKGFGHRIDALQSAILGAKLPFLDEWTAARQRLAARYTELLSDLELMLPSVDAQAESAWHLYVIRTPLREEMFDHLKTQGIGAGVHYPIPLHLQPAYADLNYSPGDLPVTEAVAKSCLSLPLYPEMSDEQQDRVVAAIRTFLEKQGWTEPNN
ncbi:MAG: DegT/DnrJ/EryC1/StrS family aminotransferase [Caldilineaceae bacterium]|nr:DegT/DnrJ/EryC1/StrS family aminotransferase [Caldilineaceae bacterium]